MSSATPPEPPALRAATSGFALAAAIAVLFNTALAWAKDAYGPLTDFMKSLTGHHWTTHGLADLVVFAGLGSVFTMSRVAQRMDANRLTGLLVGAVAIAALGLALWFALV